MDDWKNLVNGSLIPTEQDGYCDQPSIVVAGDGSWVGTVTTSSGAEGSRDQYVSILRSTDRGRNWTEPVRLEGPEGGRCWESAYSKLVVAPTGRIFCFYCYNAAHVDITDGPVYRYDMGGIFCCRFSDDRGLSWSERLTIPVRDLEIDRMAPLFHQGHELRLFWNVAKPSVHNGMLYVPLTKIACKDSFMSHTEGVLLRSANILDDPLHAVWETLPDGDVGLRGISGGGTVAEEQCYVFLSDGTICSTFRTVDGYAGFAFSRDGGHHFSPSDYFRYPDGRPVKNSRAANFLWPLGGGRYLYWFENCSYKGYYPRNPAWICAAIEQETPAGQILRLSQPEMLLYHESSLVGFSYPDLVVDQGRFFIAETQKTIARVHEIPAAFIEMLFAQFTVSAPEQDMLLVDTCDRTFKLPGLDPFVRQSLHVADTCQVTTGQGYSLDFWLDHQGKSRLFDNLSADGQQGLTIDSLDDGSVEVSLWDLRERSAVKSRKLLLTHGLHHLAVVIDGASRVVYFVVDGLFDDGGANRIFGWGTISRSLTGIAGDKTARIGDGVKRLRLYGKALTTTQCIGNFRSGPG